MGYTGSVDLVSGIRPKNNGTFPLVDAKDVRVDDNTRLDAALENISSGAVRYDAAQTLTDAQKQQARDNIGAGEVDATLSVEGMAADAKKTGDEISALKGDLSGIDDSLSKMSNALTTGDKVLVKNSWTSGYITNSVGQQYEIKTAIESTTKRNKVCIFNAVNPFTVSVATGYVCSVFTLDEDDVILSIQTVNSTANLGEGSYAIQVYASDQSYINKLDGNDLCFVYSETLLNSIEEDIQAINTDTNNSVRKNLIPFSIESQTINGLTITVNSDKSITINGTATEATRIFVSDDFNLGLGGNYILSGCPQGGNENSYYIIFYNRIGSAPPYTSSYVYDYGDGTLFESLGTSSRCAIDIKSGIVCTNLTFKPMVRNANIVPNYFIPPNDTLCDKVNRNTDLIYENEIAVERHETAIENLEQAAIGTTRYDHHVNVSNAYYRSENGMTAFYRAIAPFDKQFGYTLGIYAIGNKVGGDTTGKIYFSKDGVDFSVLGELPLDQSVNEYLVDIHVVTSNKNIIALFRTANQSGDTYNIRTYDKDLNYKSSLSLGSNYFHGSNSNIDSHKNKVWIAEYGKDYITKNLWYSSDYGVTWTNVRNKVPNVDNIKHFHNVQIDPYTETCWLSTGDGDSQCMILKYNSDTDMFDIMAGGEQRYRTLNFVFTNDYVYYGMDSPKINHPSKLYRCSKDFLTVTEVAEIPNGVPVYGLSRTFYPSGILIFTSVEPESPSGANPVICFYDFQTEKLETVFTFYNFDNIVNSGRGFVDCARYQYQSTGQVIANTLYLNTDAYGLKNKTRVVKCTIG